MLDWFSKIINVKVYTHDKNRSFMHATPPIASGRMLPDWFKKLRKKVLQTNNFGVPYEQGTIRYCPAVKNYIASGFIVPVWTDVNIRINPDKTWAYQAADPIEIIEHEKEQYQGFMEDHIHLKFLSPWFFYSKKDIDMMILDVYYHNPNKDFSIVPGFINFKYTHNFNINMFAKVKSEPYVIKLKAHDPFVHILCPNKTIKIILSKSSIEDLSPSDKFEMSKYSHRPYFNNKYGQMLRNQVKK